MIIEGDRNTIAHYGIKMRSGRYPWGSGEDPYQRSISFQSYVAELRKAGLSDVEIARGINAHLSDLNDGGPTKFNTADLRTATALAKGEQLAYDRARVRGMSEKGMSPTEIGRELGKNESQIRSLLKPVNEDRKAVQESVANLIKKRADEGGYVDVGLGNEALLGISKEKLNAGVKLLEDQGYTVHQISIEQMTNPGQYTTTLVITKPGVTLQQVQRNRDKIAPVIANTDDGGRTFELVRPPVQMSSKRLTVRYGPDGGSEMDGVIELRRGVRDLDMGGKNYAQVRIAVDGTHYMKGMAVYSDDLPKGVDVRYNTNKERGVPMLGDKDNTVLKRMETDPDFPFGSVVKNRFYTDADGKKQQSLLNSVGSKEGSGEEGGWDWRKNMSSQMLSKQSTELAREQLAMTYTRNQTDLDNIMKLTNPAVKKKMLNALADSIDSDTEYLRAASMPRQATKVLLPVRSLKENEIYAPSFKPGETVVLIRHPHGGIFEIPELKVNNTNKEAISRMGKEPKDSVGIHPNVAKKLSGADFDGDTVLVIPNNQGRIRTSKSLQGLKDFDPQRAYPYYEGMKVIGSRQQQTEMGKVSNLITDMTIKGANTSEIAAAVRHSMVVIDAKKHRLDWKTSEQQNGIAALRKLYQSEPGKKPGGASTIISRARSERQETEKRLARANEGGPIDTKTGKLRYVETGRLKPERFFNKQTGAWETKYVKATQATNLMRMTNDARTLVSSARTPVELAYANHANRMKALADKTRLAAFNTPNAKYNASAAKAYKNEVDSLVAKLKNIDKIRPYERQAQVIARANYNAIVRNNPGLSQKDKKKIADQQIRVARIRTGAHRDRIIITPKEWEAIQAGAVSNDRLTKILAKTDTDEVRKYATPKTPPKITASKVSRARMMAKRGYTQEEIASHLGVSASALFEAMK